MPARARSSLYDSLWVKRSTFMPQPVSDLLFADGPAFDFFQAVRLLERLYPERKAVGREALPETEVVRFRSLASLAFPPSSIYEVEPPNADRQMSRIVQTFLGLTGPSGVLPRHYTQMLLDLGRDVKGPERRSLGDFLALFDHRVVSLFYRAWEKYRFFVPYERGEAWWTEPDAFTSALYSLIGMGTPRLRGRLRVANRTDVEEAQERPLARVEDLALLYYAGFLTQRPRNAANLSAMLTDYFDLPAAVKQFQGQWLLLEKSDQTCLGAHGALGVSAIAGDRVWDVQAKFRIKLGPLKRHRFEEFLPDKSATPRRKSLFLLAQLTRLYAGPELDFDLQLMLEATEVPPCRIGGDGFGARLGWNTWLLSKPRDADADDAIFVADENVWLN
jgi:type VI secretion system protein ImpH